MNSKKSIRALCSVLLAAIVLSAIVNKLHPQKSFDEDRDVYLNEEVCFADGVYIKVTGISVTNNPHLSEQSDCDGDELSEYLLNLDIEVQRRSERKEENEQVIEPSYFTLKSVNMKAKSKVSVFMEALFKATLSIVVGGAVAGEISLLNETLNIGGYYFEGSIENAKLIDGNFKPIKLEDDAFSPFRLSRQSEKHKLRISFRINKECLESENVIVLAIHMGSNSEKTIFLTKRPESSSS